MLHQNILETICIGPAMVCGKEGYPLVIVMTKSFSIEWSKLMRFVGEKALLTPASVKATGMLKKNEELSRKHDWFESM